ncbi:MAG: hypothetical protein U0M06_06605 [Clostridia bacterium]|nr:hypothetical protein [Clostridia bacterium]
MKDFGNVLGNDDLKARLADDIRRNALSHAYIIEGADGSGKHTLAKEIAAALVCEHTHDNSAALPCGECRACRKILNDRSPDLITVKCEDGKTQIGVDVIRKMREDVRLLPNDFETKVYIIENAHTMNIQAQNAFLLTLEDPPKFVVFLLLCKSSSTLLETIKSRAPIIRMRPIEYSVLKSVLQKNNKDAAELARTSPKEFEEILRLSSGFMGKAIDLLDKDKRAPLLISRQMAKEFLLYLTSRKSGIKSMEVISSFSQKREELSKQLTQIETAVRDLILVKRCEDTPLCFFTDDDEASELSFKFKTSDLLSLTASVAKAKSQLAANSNVRLTLFSLAIDCGLM